MILVFLEFIQDYSKDRVDIFLKTLSKDLFIKLNGKFRKTNMIMAI